MPVPRKFCLENPESWVLESRKQLKVSGIPLTIEIQNPSYTDKDWNTVPAIQNPLRGIHNPELSCIPLHGANGWTNLKLTKIALGVFENLLVQQFFKVHLFVLFVTFDIMHGRHTCLIKSAISSIRPRPHVSGYFSNPQLFLSGFKNFHAHTYPYSNRICPSTRIDTCPESL